MKRVPFTVKMGQKSIHDAAYLSHYEDRIPPEEVAQAAVESISTDIEVRLGEHTVHLAMLLNPEHWSSEWEGLGIEDVDEFVAGLVEDEDAS